MDERGVLLERNLVRCNSDSPGMVAFVKAKFQN